MDRIGRDLGKMVLRAMPRHRGLILILALLGVSAAMAQQFPDGAGKDTTLSLCSSCHNADIIFQHRQSRDEWSAELQKMIAAGAQGTPAQFNEVLTYLAGNFGPGSAPA